MKHITLLLLTLLISANIYSQARLGYSFSEIKQEFNDERYNLEVKFNNDGDKFISVKFANIMSAYYFDNYDICRQTMLIPLTTGTFNYLVEKFNKEYVIISDTQWKLYSGINITYFEILYSKDNIPYILIH